MADAPRPLPGMSAAHERVSYWMPLLTREVGDVDAPILGDEEVHALDARNRASEHQFDLRAPVTEADVRARLADRFSQIRQKIAGGELFDASGQPLSGAFAETLDPNAPLVFEPVVRVTVTPVHVLCTPRDAAYYTSATDRRFDRNQCSHVRAQEPMQVLGRFAGRYLVRTRYAIGFIGSLEPLSRPVPQAELAEVIEGPRVRLEAPLVLTGLTLPKDTRVLTDRAGGAVVYAPTRRVVPLPAHVTRPVLTRRALVEEAFHYLGEPYGWGGQAGGLDCSNFVMDVLASFGLSLPRHSADQIESGSYTVEVPAELDESGRERLLDEANRAGVVLVQFPGHIMLYLGRDAEGRQTAVHSFAEYVETCDTPAPDGRTETLRRAPGVSVTHLDVGRGTSRRAFIERMTKLSVIGRARPSLAPSHTGRVGEASPVETRACGLEDAPSIFRSPRRPHAGGELRLLHTSPTDPAPVSIAVVSATGERFELPVERRGGPPYGFVATWASAHAGTFTVLVGDGANVRACETIVVEPARAPNLRPVTSARNVWDEHAEALYSLFVEKLFDYPLDDRTWSSLDQLLVVREKNVLFDHFSANEESRMRLAPDCADLPVFLRAYFAWKMGLPFGYRSCSRGGEGEPPQCGPLASNLEYVPEEESNNPITDFLDFVNGPVRGAVHSASGRTVPRDENTDLYPVPLTREALRPGTVYADPYGHVMTIVRYVPQTDTSYGMLVAADAQPDATIGMPRFWRGTFLFTPETREVGAGFKAFRPVFRAGQRARALGNAELRGTRTFTPYSTMQYDGSLDDFYDRVEAVIDPAPLDPVAKLVSLVDALEDSVQRRVVSVNNAQGFLATHPVTIPMPRAAEIFLTTGPWEDFSTPSRDLRLLIALDAVVTFPDRVERAPERYRVPRGQAEAVIARLRARLEEELAARRVRYPGTSGEPREITLADVRARAAGFEVAYNPNDCPEVRWAAPAGSEELSACRRRAPEAQRQMMERYRGWFRDRRRPAM